MTMLETFASIVASLENENIDYMIVGSLASMTYGEPRLTKDMDLVIELTPQQTRRIYDLFPEPDYYTPPAEILGQEVINRGQFNILHLPSGLKVDFIVKKLSPHGTAEFSRRKRVELTPELSAWMASPEDVIIKKLAYFRDGKSMKHIDDIKGILANTEIDMPYLSGWVEQLGLQQEFAKTSE